MKKAYRLLKAPAGWPEQLEFRLQLAEGTCGVGEECELDLTAEEEAANVASGLLAVVGQEVKA